MYYVSVLTEAESDISCSCLRPRLHCCFPQDLRYDTLPYTPPKHFLVGPITLNAEQSPQVFHVLSVVAAM